MDWKRAMEEERAVLMRIVALILALADLAELACDRPPAARGFVFWILDCAESAVRDFVAGPAGALPAPAVRSSDVRADFIHLASRLRELAREVERQARPAFSLSGRNPGGTEPFPHRAGRMLRAIRAVTAPHFVRPSLAPDTS